MDNPVTIALIIAGIGMTLLFLSLALFYGLLVLLTRLFPARQNGHTVPTAETPEIHGDFAAEQPARLQVALVAVALARAEAELVLAKSHSATVNETAGSSEASPWWRLYHQHRVAPKPPSRRAP